MTTQSFIAPSVLAKWLEEERIPFENHISDIVLGIEHADAKNWSYVFLHHKPIGPAEPLDQPDWSGSRVIGVTSDGRAGLFSYHRQNVDPCGYIDAIQLEKETAAIQTPADLHAWLDTTVSPMLGTESLATP